MNIDLTDETWYVLLDTHSSFSHQWATYVPEEDFTMTEAPAKKSNDYVFAITARTVSPHYGTARKTKLYWSEYKEVDASEVPSDDA